MAIIGTLTKTQAGFAGTIKTLTLDIGVTLRPAEKETDQAPDYRFYAGDADVGAAWQKVSAAGSEYLSCKFDDPSFPAPVYASLVLREDGKPCDLIGSREAEGRPANPGRPLRVEHRKRDGALLSVLSQMP